MPALFLPAFGVETGTTVASSLLTVHSVLTDLPLYCFDADADDDVWGIAQVLQQQPQLPGVLVHTRDGQSVALSRSQIFEALPLGPLRQGGCQTTRQGTDPTASPTPGPTNGPLANDLSPGPSFHTLLHPSLSRGCLSSDTSILDAARRALRRPLHQQNIPLVVETPTGMALLSAAVLNQAYWQLRGIESQIRYERLQLEQLQNEKMAALGRLVDGVAHEILDPISFIWGNLAHISNYTQTLLALVEAYAEEVPQPSAQLQARCEEAELDYLQTDLPEAIRSVRGGAHRLRQLAISLQNFCHIDEVYPKPADLHSLLDSLLLLLQSRIKTPLQIRRDYGKLPPVPCFAGQLGQVFMSILTSVTDALLAQQLTSGQSPALAIATRVCNAPASQPAGRWIEVLIQDNGPGLPATVEQALAAACVPHAQRIKETRLTLSSRIVTAKHGGCFQVRSQQFTQPELRIDQGTEFQVLLPLMPPDS